MERYTPIRSITEIMEQLRAQEPEAKAPPPKRKRKTDIRTIRRRWREKWHERSDPGRLCRNSLRDHFHKLRREIRARGLRQERGANWEWDLTLEQWANMWLSCPAVSVGVNVNRPAWTRRGRDKNNDVQLRRADPKKAYTINNLEIWKGKQKLWPEEPTQK